jgi:hypothetical protein
VAAPQKLRRAAARRLSLFRWP